MKRILTMDESLKVIDVYLNDLLCKDNYFNNFLLKDLLPDIKAGTFGFYVPDSYKFLFSNNIQPELKEQFKFDIIDHGRGYKHDRFLYVYNVDADTIAPMLSMLYYDYKFYHYDINVMIKYWSISTETYNKGIAYIRKYYNLEHVNNKDFRTKVTLPSNSLELELDSKLASYDVLAMYCDRFGDSTDQDDFKVSAINIKTNFMKILQLLDPDWKDNIIQVNISQDYFQDF